MENVLKSELTHAHWKEQQFSIIDDHPTKKTDKSIRIVTNEEIRLGHRDGIAIEGQSIEDENVRLPGHPHPPSLYSSKCSGSITAAIAAYYFWYYPEFQTL